MKSRTLASSVALLGAICQVSSAVGLPASPSTWVTPREHIEFPAAKTAGGLTMILPIGSSSDSLRVTHVAWSPDGKYLASFGDGNARLWDARTGRLVRVVPARKLAFRPKDGAVSYDGCDLHDALTGDVIRSWPLKLPSNEPRGDVMDRVYRIIPGITFSSDGRWLATYSGEDGCIRISDVRASRQIRNLYAQHGSIDCADFSRDGRLLATAHDGVKVWDWAAGTLIKTVETSPYAETVGFSRDGKTLFTAIRSGIGSDRAHLAMWDTDTWAQRAVFQDVWAEGLAFGPNGATIAVAGLREMQLRDAKTGAIVRTFKGFREAARGVAFSPDGRKLAGASMDGTLTVWDVTSGRILAAMLTLPPSAIKPRDPRSGLVQEPRDAARPSQPPVGATPAWRAGQEQREWIAFTPDGYYTGSEDAEAFMQWESANGRVPGAAYRKRFRQPKRVADALGVS